VEKQCFRQDFLVFEQEIARRRICSFL